MSGTLAVGGMTRTENPGGGRLRLELGVGLVDGNIGRAARGEAAIGIQPDPFGVDMVKRLLHAPGHPLGRLDLGGSAVHAAETDAAVVRELTQDAEIAGHGDGELQDVLVDGELPEKGHDGLVAALPDPALPSLVAPAEVDGRHDTVHARHDLVEKAHAEIGLGIGVIELGADARVSEQAQVRVVELCLLYTSPSPRDS